MKIEVKNQKFENLKSDALILNVFEGGNLNGTSHEVDKALSGLIKTVIQEEEFKGKLGSTLVIRTNNNTPAKKIIIVGLGKKEKFDIDALRKVISSTLKCAKKEKAKSVISLTHSPAKISSKEVGQAFAEIAHLGLYSFDKYKSKNEDSKKTEIETLTILETDKGKIKGLEDGIKRGSAIAKAQIIARDLVSEPALAATPTKLANVAIEVAKSNGLKIKILDRDDCKKLGMGAFLAVAQGSEEPPKFIEIKYTPKGKAKKHVVIIGKGVTFDSGGLSLKPANSMETMKDDMSGAAAVIGTMSTMKEIQPKVAVTMIVAATENMPSGTAIRPGDVVKAMNGKTIEILNTDAEGRVTLADAVSYAVKQEPDEIIDLATLTGACVVALGDTACGVMTNNQRLADKIIKAGNETGERMWQLPLFEEDREKLRSDIADMINTGSKGKSGAQNGAVFIEQYVNDIPWVHIDIAGPSWIDKENEWGPKGPTGVGVRTLVNYLTNYA